MNTRARGWLDEADADDDCDWPEWIENVCFNNTTNG